MPQLYGKIRINGKELFQYESVIVDSNDNDRKFGMKASLEMEQSIGDTELFVKRKKDRDTIEISLYKCDTLGRPLPITEDELFELNRIMFAKEGLSVVENHDFVYYGVFQSGTSWRNTAKQGYIKIEFEMATTTPMSRVRYISRHILTEGEIDIINKCNAGEYSIADIEVENLQGSTFTIENVLTDEKLTITGVEVDGCNVIVTFAKEVAGTYELNYAASSGTGGNKRGNICDSDRCATLSQYIDDSENIYAPNGEINYRPKDKDGNFIFGEDYPMQNWCIPYSYIINF